MSELYIGLMSGTSLDGIDAALVDFSHTTPKIIGTHYTPYSESTRRDILALCEAGNDEIVRMGTLDVQLGKAFANAANTLLKQQAISSKDIKAIGSHGQTIRHLPTRDFPFTLQIGDPNIIAAETGITTVSDFRRKDIALGGQGAPLVPAFHNQIFRDKKINRAILNIGGIANVTLLSKDNDHIIGFDTGPGNTLLDAWITKQKQKHYDANGEYAQSGKIIPELLATLLRDPYFQLQAPKSTGREYFNLAWLQPHLHSEYAPADIQNTLTELTAQSIIQAIKNYFSEGEIYICGGGMRNQFLIERIKVHAATQFKVESTSAVGINPDWMEAVAFAWLAKQTLNKLPGNLPSVTGAKTFGVLGAIYY